MQEEALIAQTGVSVTDPQNLNFDFVSVMDWILVLQ